MVFVRIIVILLAAFPVAREMSLADCPCSDSKHPDQLAPCDRSGPLTPPADVGPSRFFSFLLVPSIDSASQILSLDDVPQFLISYELPLVSFGFAYAYRFSGVSPPRLAA